MYEIGTSSTGICAALRAEEPHTAGEPFGKAGAYGIQGPAGAWVKQIRGDYFSVMGFPVHAFAAEVASLLKQGLFPSVR